MQSSKKKVGIIGSGVAGLLAAKYALEEGLLPEVFQRSKQLGGVWHPETGAVWKEMTTNISKYSVFLKGHPWPEDAPVLPPAAMVQEYLLNYAKKFHILEHINFNSEVLSVERQKKQSGNVYALTVKKDGNLNLYEYEYLIIGTGFFNVPHIPDLEGLKNFKGNVMHSRYYRSGQPYSGKRVFVLGGSMTGVELSSNISKHTKNVYHSFKYPFWVFNHFIQAQGIKLPLDFFQTRLPYLDQSNPNANTTLNLIFQKACKQQQDIPQLRIDEKNYNKLQYKTISDDYVNQVKAGKITPVRSVVKRVQENSVVLAPLSQDGKEIVYEVDEIIACTGYKCGLNYLSKQIQEILQYQQNDQFKPIILYKDLLHPKLQNLYFIGMYKHTFFAILQLQAQFAIGSIVGKVSRPSQQQFQKGLTEYRLDRNDPDKGQLPHKSMAKYGDQIAKELGHEIHVEKLLKEEINPQTIAYLKMPALACVENCFTAVNVGEQMKEAGRIIQKVCQKV